MMWVRRSRKWHKFNVNPIRDPGNVLRSRSPGYHVLSSVWQERNHLVCISIQISLDHSKPNNGWVTRVQAHIDKSLRPEISYFQNERNTDSSCKTLCGKRGKQCQ